MTAYMPLNHCMVRFGGTDAFPYIPLLLEGLVSPTKGSSTSPDLLPISGTCESEEKGEHSRVAALAIEPSRLWVDFIPKPSEEWTSAKSERFSKLSDSSTQRKTPEQLSVSCASNLAIDANRLPSGLIRIPKDLIPLVGSWHVTPKPEADPYPIGFGYPGPLSITSRGSSRPGTTKSFYRLATWNATPPIWVDLAPPGLGFQKNSEAEFEQQNGSSAAERHQILAQQLTAKGFNLPREAYVPVKNTFIDALPEDLPDDQPPPVTRAASAPMVIGLRPALLSPEHLPREPGIPLPQPGLELANIFGLRTMVFSPEHLPREPRIPLPPSGLELVDISEEFSNSEMIPETMTDFPSIGSSLHGSGQCKPCAWFHKPKGCHRKEQCRHCHACAPEELTKRKKAKAAVLKAQAKGVQMARMQQKLILQANKMMGAACEPFYQTPKPLPLALLVI